MGPLSLRFKLLVAVCVLMIPSGAAFGQAYKALVGFDALVDEKGAALEDGSGLLVMMAEAQSPAGSGNFYLDQDHAEFTGKSFTEASGTSGVSNHATSVGRYFFGDTTSMSAGITDISMYGADDYLGNVLGYNSGVDPSAQGFDIGNHSYVGRASAGFTAAVAEDLLERFDFVINRDNTIMVVGADNINTTPRVLAPSYNAITVGLSNGDHSTTMTPNYGPSRYATHIVVPSLTLTSQATPVVTSAAAILREAGSGTNFEQNEVIRSTLFAGATKDEFASWDRTATRPMDEVFGFGELNILNSYHIFEGGEFDGTTSEPTSNVGDFGWDNGSFDGTNDVYYGFSIDPTGYVDVSAVLSWNMEITDTNPGAGFTASRSLADLNLELFDSSGTFLGSLLDASNGTDYNNEHIFFQGLEAGDYTFRVSGDLAVGYGFSWMIVNAVPEPSSLMVLGMLSVGLISRRRRSAS